MAPKQYKISTVQDMIDCTNEKNLDAFLKDLKSVIETAHAVGDLANIVGEIEGLSKDESAIESDGFIWIDDGKNDISITFKTDGKAKTQ